MTEQRGDVAQLRRALHESQALAFRVSRERLTALLAACDRYGRHLDGCAANATVWRTVDGPPTCDCGFDALGAAAGPTPDAQASRQEG